MPIDFPPPPDLVDPLGQPLRDALEVGTFSNAPAPPMPTLEAVASASKRLDALRFQIKSRSWYQNAGWRAFRRLAEQQQEAVVKAFLEPKMALGVDPGFDSRSAVVCAVHASTRIPSPRYAIVDIGAPPYRRCAACGVRKRSLKRRRYPYCAPCAS